MGLTEIDYPNAADRFNQRINDYERRISALELSRGPYFVLPTIAARDSAGTPSPGTKIYVASKRTEYLWDAQVSGGPVVLSYPGVNGYVSTPDTAALDVVGDIEIVARVALDDWTNGIQMIAAKDDTSSNRSYEMYINGTANLVLDVFAPAYCNFNSTVVLPFTDGVTYWIKATLDVNNGAAGKTAQFWYAADTGNNTEPAVWTQLGANVTTATTIAISSTAAPLWIGARGNLLSPVSIGDVFASGRFYRVIIRNGIGGSIVGDMNSANMVSSAATFVSGSLTWTLNNLGPGWVIMSEPEQFYTPTWTNLTLGTGYTTSGRFHRSDGYIDFYQEVILGTGGAATGAISVSTPNSIPLALTQRGAHQVHILNAGVADIFGSNEALAAGATTMTLLTMSPSGALVTWGGTSATTPHTWKLSDRIRWSAHAKMNYRYT